MKKRNWTFLVWLDSMPQNWLEIIQNTGLPFAVSPLHDKDINENGEEKKPHFHIIICYPGPTTYKNVKNLTDKLNTTIPLEIESVEGMYRYFTHKDNPEKYQYNKKDIRVFNGFDIDKYDCLTKTQIKAIIMAIQQFIIDNYIYEYGELMDILLEKDLIEWHEVASTHTTFFNSYITSRRHALKDKRGQ